MKTFRSSILSFDTLNLEGWKAAGLRNEILVAILLLIGAELLARSVLAPIGDYWRYWEPEVAVKIETYRAMVRKGAPPHILIVGDSTGEFDIDPVGVADDSMSEGPDVYNLAWAANRAEAFRKCTLPILAKGPMSELVVVSLSPDAFIESRASRQSEQAITSSSFCKNLNGERSVADYLYLARVRWAWPFLESWWSGRKLPYAPNSGGFAGLDRDFGRVPARFADGSVVPERFAVIADLVRLADWRGFKLVFVLPPRIDPTPYRLNADRQYREYLMASALPVLDYGEVPFLTRRNFADQNHLNRAGARIYSHQLGRDIAFLNEAGLKQVNRNGKRRDTMATSLRNN